MHEFYKISLPWEGETLLPHPPLTLNFWIWRRCLKLHGFGPWGPPPGPPCGHMYHMNNLEFPAPKDYSYQVWLTSDMCFQEEDETVTFYIGPPSPSR